LDDLLRSSLRDQLIQKIVPEGAVLI